jgi:hypothetical protein
MEAWLSAAAALWLPNAAFAAVAAIALRRSNRVEFSA